MSDEIPSVTEHSGMKLFVTNSNEDRYHDVVSESSVERLSKSYREEFAI